MTKKQQSDSVQKKRAGIWFCILAVFMVELFFYTWCQVQCVNTGYAISTEIENGTRLSAVQSNMNIELATLRSPRRISKIAANKLGLKMSTDQQVVIIQ